VSEIANAPVSPGKNIKNAVYPKRKHRNFSRNSSLKFTKPGVLVAPRKDMANAVPVKHPQSKQKRD
jgi:hypothetical protein